jgi:large subunit ribosomal protein L21
MYAVIETGSKQYRVEVGTELQVELLDVAAGETITLERVLLVADGDTAAIGRPVVDGATVSAEVLRQERGDKVIAFKYRPKARRRVKKGHRQELTILRVADIVFGGKSAAEAVRKTEAAAKTERQRLEEAAARQAAEDAALAARLAKAGEAKAAEEKAAEAKAAKAKAGTGKAADTKAGADDAKAKRGPETPASGRGQKSTSTTGKASAPANAEPGPAPARRGAGKAPRAAADRSKAGADAPKRSSRTKKDE